MTFGLRLSDNIDAIHSKDPALADVDATLLEHYLMTRDLSVLPASAVSGSTVLTLRPLLVEYEHLAAMATEPVAMRALFRHHVCGVRGPLAAHLKFETKSGRKELAEDSADLLSLEFVSEIVNLVAEASSRKGDSRPFSAPDSWRLERRQSAKARALAALVAPTSTPAPTTDGATGGQSATS